MNLAYEFGLLRDATDEYGDGGRSSEALVHVEDAFRRMRAALEDIAAGRREFDLSRSDEQFDFVESFWFLVKLAEGVVGED